MTEEKESFFKKHKKTLIGVGIGIGATVAVGAAYILIRGNNVDSDIAKIRTVIIGHHNTVVTVLERRGHPGNMVLCNQTGEVFASQRRAADACGINPSELSKHLRGLKDSVKGLTFENLGEAK